MREKKFRVWDKEAKQMSGSFALFGEFTLLGGVHSWQGELIPFTHKKGCISRLNDLIEMQFTGLHDKNGKEIYEGDIYLHNTTGNIGVVTYDEGRYFIDGKNISPFYSIPNMNNGEVIGSIYQNPELLA